MENNLNQNQITENNIPGIIYANFYLRLAALIVDLAILLSSFFIFLAIIFLITGDHSDNVALALAPLIAAPLMLIYGAYFHSSKHHATPGKILFKIQVLNLNHEGLSFSKAFIRSISKFFLSGLLTVGFGFTFASLTKRGQALHDFIVGSVVVRKF